MQSTLVIETRNGPYWRNESGAGEVWYSTRAGSLTGYPVLSSLMILRGCSLSELLEAKARNAALARLPVE